MMIMVMTLDDVKMITVMINVMLAIIYRDGGDGHGDDENVKKDVGGDNGDADIIIECQDDHVDDLLKPFCPPSQQSANVLHRPEITL